jgi:hypothetical protein
MTRFESRDVLVSVGEPANGEMAWADGDAGKTCGTCTNTTAKPRPKPKPRSDDSVTLRALREQLRAARA